MPKNRSERRMYRRSPGRQYEHDAFKSRIGQDRQDASGNSDLVTLSQNGSIPARTSGQLVQRPNLRRTRQLTRQSILESKRSAIADAEQQEQAANELMQHVLSPIYDDEEQEDRTLYSSRRAARDAYLGQPQLPSTRQLSPDEEAYADEYADEEQDDYADGPWQDVDPDAGYQEEYDEPDPMDVRLREYAPVPSSRAERTPIAKRTRQLDDPYEDYEDDGYEDYEEDEPVRRGRREDKRRRKSKKLSRRGLLIGLGAVAVGGAAYEIVPKIPSAVGGAATNIEQQLQAAFEKGLAQGADNARREIIGSLETLEGFTLDGAIGAAKLTRVAYDVFVSPIITQSANVTGNILNAMLQAVKTARGILAQSFLDNSTLVAIQKVLQSWVDQVSNMPKQLNAITDTDLDGAQAYLNALKQKIAAEKAQLSKSSSSTPTPTATKSQ